MDCGVFVGCCNLGGNDVDPFGLPSCRSVHVQRTSARITKDWYELRFGPFSNIGLAYSGVSGKLSWLHEYRWMGVFAGSCYFPGRVSHALSLRGPCFTVDTACSSTIVAVDSSSQAVRMGRPGLQQIREVLR